MVAIRITEPSTGNRSVIKSFSLNNDCLTINIETIEFGEDCAMSYWCFLLGVDKEIVDNVNDVKIIKDNIDIIPVVIQI